jgi:hypothetical protein
MRLANGDRHKYKCSILRERYRMTTGQSNDAIRCQRAAASAHFISHFGSPVHAWLLARKQQRTGRIFLFPIFRAFPPVPWCSLSPWEWSERPAHLAILWHPLPPFFFPNLLLPTHFLSRIAPHLFPTTTNPLSRAATALCKRCIRGADRSRKLNTFHA